MPFDQGMLLSVAQVDLPDATTEIVLQGVPCSKGWLDHSLDPGLRWRGGRRGHGRLCWIFGLAECQQRGLVTLWGRRLHMAVELAFSRGHGEQIIKVQSKVQW